MKKIKELLIQLEHDIRTIEISKEQYKNERLEDLRYLVIDFMKKNYKRLYKKWLNFDVK